MIQGHARHNGVYPGMRNDFLAGRLRVSGPTERVSGDALTFSGRKNQDNLDKTGPVQTYYKWLIRLANVQPSKFILGFAFSTVDVVQAATIHHTATHDNWYFRDLAVKRTFFLLSDKTKGDVLKPFFNDPHPAIIQRAATVIQSFGSDAAKGEFISLFDAHPNPLARLTTTRALRYMKSDRKKMPILLNRLKDKDPLVRFEAINSALTLRRSARIQQLVKPMISDADPLVRQWAVSVLEDHPPSRLQELKRYLMQKLQARRQQGERLPETPPEKSEGK